MSIQDELKSITGFSKGLPIHAIYLAGLAKGKSHKSFQEIFNLLQAVYRKVNNNEIGKELQNILENKIYEGKIEEAMNILDENFGIWPAKKSNSVPKKNVSE